MTRTEKAASPLDTLPSPIVTAVEAALAKKASHVTVLDLRKGGAFADYFVIGSGQTSRQVTAIVDAIEEALKAEGIRPSHIEGYERADWVLMDYFDFIVHVFTPQMRAFYGLERLWGSAVQHDIPDDRKPAR
ncbi:MAG: ribosome silencing factor [Vicinamibacterales bacterium]